MIAIIGFLIVIGCVAGGYAGAGGHFDVLFQPFEVVIIVGAAIGAFIIASPLPHLKNCFKGFGHLIGGPKHAKKEYLELLTMLYMFFKVAKTEGVLALEGHVENPETSSIFEKFPKFRKDHHAEDFLRDYLRLVTLGITNPYQMDDLMTIELEAHHEEWHAVQATVQNMGDGMPALGIVAAVLGVIHTMGSIDQPPEILGHLIGAALVGTFLGILLSYGFITPAANSLGYVYEAEGRYYKCMKDALLAYMQNHPPAIAVEFARKGLYGHERPSFYELDEAINEAS